MTVSMAVITVLHFAEIVTLTMIVRIDLAMRFLMTWLREQNCWPWRRGSVRIRTHIITCQLLTIQSRNSGTIIDIEDYINEKGDRVLK